jgi:hypothetical protein
MIDRTYKRLTAGGTLPRCQGTLRSNGEQCRYSGKEQAGGKWYCLRHIEWPRQRAQRKADRAARKAAA